jgi:uncharacterized protein
MLDEYKKILIEKGEVYLRVKVRPNSSSSNIAVAGDDEIKINIAAKPEKGKANMELIRFLAKEFDINKNNVKIISGVNNRIKLLKITK